MDEHEKILDKIILYYKHNHNYNLDKDMAILISRLINIEKKVGLDTSIIHNNRRIKLQKWLIIALISSNTLLVLVIILKTLL